MRILALDTATAATTVALCDSESGEQCSARDDPPAGARPRHASRLLGLVETVLAEAGGWDRVDRIAVGVGPGTFTGLRIGVATAQALAVSRGIPLVPVSTLASLALAAGAAGQEAGLPVLAVIDARRGEAFAGGPGTEAQVLVPAALAPVASGHLVIGDGAILFREVLERAGARIPPDASALHRVDAVWHTRLGVEAVPASPHAVQPVYLRLPDAELTRRP